MAHLNPPDAGGLSRPTGIPTGEKMKREKTHYLRLAVLFLVLTIIQSSCETTEPDNNEKLYIEVADISCTESWIKVETSGVNLPAELKLYRDNTLAQKITVKEKSTVIYDSLLSPSQSYTYQAKLPGIASREITATTLDTTSHNFSWETFTFGEHSSSALYDVAIINENNIWAVGEIYLNDSTGQPDPHAYNAVHWDGESWKVMKILYKGGSWTIRTIFAFGEDDIWFSAFVRYDGENFNELPIPDVLTGWRINKIWGTSSEDLYVVGDNGNIARFDGSNWQKIESGTSLQFLDIYGGIDQNTGKQQILAVCTQNYPGDRAIYSIEGNTADKISSYPIQWELFGVWFIPNRHYYVVGSGIYEKRSLSDTIWKNEPRDITRYGITKIRGTELNNVFAVGAFGEFLHWNGLSYKSYISETSLPNGSFSSVSVKTNLVIAVGANNSQAVIIIGRK